jgi:uncharacterized protein YbaP (TraB family)
MRNNYIIWLIALLSLLCEPVLATSKSAENESSIHESGIPQRGSLYRIRYHDHTSYLFGTIHVGRPEFFPLEAQATRALSEADTLALEFDLRDVAAMQTAIQKYGLYANHDTVDMHLSASSLQRLQEALKQYDIPYARVSQMKAWMVTFILQGAVLAQQGYHTELATETYLTSAAVAQGKNIVGLESAELQLSLFDSMTERQQEQYLLDNLNDLQSGEMRKKTQELVDAWATANEKTFDSLLKEAQSDKTTEGKFILDILLSKRNPEMAKKIETMLKDDKASFVAIGLLHLVGPNGIPQLLARRGFEVTRLY